MDFKEENYTEGKIAEKNVVDIDLAVASSIIFVFMLICFLLFSYFFS